MDVKYLINKIVNNNYSMVSRIRLLNLSRWCVEFKNSNASFVECGVAKGGCLTLMKYLSNNKQIWGFDSFEGMPEQTEKDEGDGEGWVGYNCSGKGIDTVYKTFKKLNIDMENVNIVKGFFEDTIYRYKERIGKIAILRLDNDWYESTKFCLEGLYDGVIKGGVIIVDDYGTFVGCKKAVDEFRSERNITSKLHNLDNHEHYWIKD